MEHKIANGDVIIIKKHHKDIARYIRGLINMTGKYLVIALGGVPGIGKTEVALELSKLSGYKVVSLDNYYKVERENRDKHRAEDIENNVGLSEIDWERLEKDVEGKTIVEGIYALNYPADIGVFLDGTLKDTYDFRKERGKEDPDDDFRRKVLKKEAEVVDMLKENSNIVVDVTKFLEENDDQENN